MSEFLFVSDLNIENPKDLFVEETEESLKGKELIIKEEIHVLSYKLALLNKKLDEIQKQLTKFEQAHRDIILGKPTLTKNDSIYEKACFLFDLFHGRRDVYATRRWNKEKEKVSYFPRCINAWSQVCPLKLQKDSGIRGKKADCSSCNYKHYEELNPNLIIIRQLRNPDEHGNNSIGIYPMLNDNVCRFVAMDFDESTWKEDAITVADEARKSGFQIAIERSFSGNGAHLWLFFSEDVPAFKARKLVFSFLDKACQLSKTLSLNSYDRIFPTQDTIEENGLGNLILMPLVFGAVRRKEDKGTVFVNNNFQVYPDQIAFLSSLPRYAEKDIDIYLSEESASRFQLLPEIKIDEIDVLVSKRLPQLSQKDVLDGELPVFLSAGISIPKAVISPKLQDALKRMTCFSNPEYYKAIKRNRGYVPEGISSFVQTSIESETVLQMPRGYLDFFKRYMKISGIKLSEKDLRVANTNLQVFFSGELYNEQEAAVEALLEHDIGVLKAATSFGKTVVAAKLIAERKEKTLVLVEKTDLLKQWKKSLQAFLKINSDPEMRPGKRVNKTKIGIYSGSTDSVCGLVDIATFQSLSSRMPEFVRNYGMVIVDECHHVAADSFTKVLQTVRPKYLYGLSATVKRDDGLEKIVFAHCGNIVFEYKASQLANLRGIAQSIVPRFTCSTVSLQTSRTFNHTKAIKELSADNVRNNLIVQDSLQLVHKNKKVLILTALIEHASTLQKLLKNSGAKAVMINGSMSKTDLANANEVIESGNCSIIISTGKYLGEGTDIPYLDSLMIASPISWEGVVSQYAGRIARQYEGKTKTLIYDYVDVNIPQYAKMYIKRLSTYRKLGYSLSQHESEAISGSNDNLGLFHEKSFYSQFDILEPIIDSIRCAKTRIIISSPEIFISSSTKTLSEELQKAKLNGIEVEIRTKTIETALNKEAQTESLTFFKEQFFTVIHSQCDFLRFAVIDSNEVWFGNINLLGGAIKKKQTDDAEQKVMMHIYSASVAKSLEDSCLGLL